MNLSVSATEILKLFKFSFSVPSVFRFPSSVFRYLPASSAAFMQGVQASVSEASAQVEGEVDEQAATSVKESLGQSVSLLSSVRDGAKAVAEIPMDGVGPALCNAVYNAAGVWILDAPILPEKVWSALGEKNV